MPNPFQHCDNSVTPSCPIGATVYGYYPSIPWNIAYVVIFTLCCIGQIFLGFRFKIKSYTWTVGLGCFSEVVGYAARIVLRENPWDEWAVGTQYIALVIAPAFLAAGIYLALKHAMLSISPQHSYIRPKLYTWIFISCDAVSVTIQAVGGGVASAANTDTHVSAKAFNTVLLVGMCIQVFTLLVFGIMAGLYAHNVSRDRHALHSDAASLLKSRQFGKFVFAMSLAYLVILIRCAYRVGAASRGWKNSISRNQVSFMILDGLMCVFAALAMTLIHPGIYFKAMSNRNREQQSQNDRIEKNNGLFTFLSWTTRKVMPPGGTKPESAV